MRLAVVSPFLDRRHGTELCIIEQIERLAVQHNWDVDIYSQRVEDVANLTKDPVSTISDSSPQIIWRRVSSLPGPHLVQFLWWLFANTLARWRARSTGRPPDVTYSPGINCFDADAIVVHIVFHEFYARVRSELRLRNIPVRNWPVTLHRLLYYRLIMFLERRIYTNPRVRLAAVSQLVSDQLQSYFHRHDVVLVPNAVDINRFDASVRLARRAASRAALGVSETDFVLLLIGNDWKKKGLDALLRAIHLNANLPLHLLVVGRDEPSLYAALLSDLGLQNRVRFLAPSPDVLRFYSAADAYVGPSLEDAFGLPVLEAMACGLPVISSVRSGVSTLIENEVNGLLLRNPESAEDLAEFISWLYNDPAFRQKLSQAGLQNAVCHTWDHNAAMTHDFLVASAHEKSPSDTRSIDSRPDLPANSPAPLRRESLPALTGIRFFAAFYVVLFHAMPWVDTHFNLPLPLKTFLGNGYLAVCLFFLLSGFILAYTYAGNVSGFRNRAKFWEARIARIYPVYLLSLALALPFQIHRLSLKTACAVLLMVQAWNPLHPEMSGAWNYPAWSLSLEAFFYLCFPLIQIGFEKLSGRVLLLLGALALAVVVVLHSPVQGLGNWTHVLLAGIPVPLPILRLPEFLLGMLLGNAFIRYPAERIAGALAVPTMLAAIVILSVTNGPWVSLVALPFALLIYSLASSKSSLALFFSAPLTLLLGGASYSVYLLQAPVRDWVRVLFKRSIILNSISAPMTPLILVLFSILVFRLWEEPMRRAIRRWFYAAPTTVSAQAAAKR